MHLIKRLLITAAALLLVSLAFSAPTRIESTKRIAAPDGSRSVVVDQIFPIVDGQPERFSGRVMIRVTDAEGTTTQQRYIETTQIRVVQPPVWLDDRWCAFSYNIAKNSNGMIYFDSQEGEAVQVEFVATARRMGATNKVETELTSLDVTSHGTTVTLIRNVTHDGASIFPLPLRSLPSYQNAPYGKDFLDEVRGALTAYQDFCTKRGVSDIRLEQASESFNESDTRMAVLACSAGGPVIIIAPVKSESAADSLTTTTLVKLDNDVDLRCFKENTPESDTDQQDNPGYTTVWKNETFVQVEREIFSVEDEPSAKVTLYQVSTDGRVVKVPPSAKSAGRERGTTTSAGSRPPKSKPSAAKTEKKPVGESGAKTGKETPASNRDMETKKPGRTNSRSATPPPDTAAPEPTKRPGFLQRILPGSRAPQATPTPNQ